MPTQCKPLLFAFQGCGGRRVTAAFDGGAITSSPTPVDWSPYCSGRSAPAGMVGSTRRPVMPDSSTGVLEARARQYTSCCARQESCWLPYPEQGDRRASHMPRPVVSKWRKRFFRLPRTLGDSLGRRRCRSASGPCPHAGRRCRMRLSTTFDEPSCATTRFWPKAEVSTSITGNGTGVRSRTQIPIRTRRHPITPPGPSPCGSSTSTAAICAYIAGVGRLERRQVRCKDFVVIVNPSGGTLTGSNTDPGSGS